MISKRYKDIFNQFVYNNQKTPLTVGTLVVCALCFLMLLISIFTRITIVHPWFSFEDGFEVVTKTINYSPQIPVMILVIYLLRQGFSLLTFSAYLLVGFFVWPIFVLGGGLSYFKNYLFGYMLGFFVAIFIAEIFLKKGQNLKNRVLMAVLSVLSMHLCGFLYCIILALFHVIDVELVTPIVSASSGNKILYDLIFSIAVIIVAPCIKNILWTCMKPKFDKTKKSKNRRLDKRRNDASALENVRERNKIIGDNIN